ncbi:MAG: hypothetical protein RSB38_02610, partial [Oscillospiraceae bacterium]
PTLTENYQLSEAVYDYLFGTLEIKPRWKSVENTAVLTDGFTQPDTFSETMKNDLCASVRVYENKENLTVVGVQNSAGRFRFDSTVGNMTPYKIQGETKVKVRLEGNKKYRYVALPSGSTGTVQADTEGFAQFGFSNTTHEIFYIMPLEAPNLQKLNEIAERSKTWKSALTFDGRVTPLAK